MIAGRKLGTEIEYSALFHFDDGLYCSALRKNKYQQRMTVSESDELFEARFIRVIASRRSGLFGKTTAGHPR